MKSLYGKDKEYLSFSALDLWTKNRDEYRKRYYEGIRPPDNVFTMYGRSVHQQIESDPQFADIRLPVAEKKIEVTIGGVPVLGYIDTLDPETYLFADYKTSVRKSDGTSRWTAVEVQKTDQLVFYSLLLQEKFKVKPNKCYLVWLETERVKESQRVGGVEIVFEEKMKLTGHRQRFDRKIYEYDRKRIRKWIISGAKEIEQDYKQWMTNK